MIRWILLHACIGPIRGFSIIGLSWVNFYMQHIVEWFAHDMSKGET